MTGPITATTAHDTLRDAFYAIGRNPPEGVAPETQIRIHADRTNAIVVASSDDCAFNALIVSLATGEMFRPRGPAPLIIGDDFPQPAPGLQRGERLLGDAASADEYTAHNPTAVRHALTLSLMSLGWHIGDPTVAVNTRPRQIGVAGLSAK